LTNDKDIYYEYIALLLRGFNVLKHIIYFEKATGSAIKA